MPQVIKSDNTRVSFNSRKLQTSLRRVLHRRPVTQEQIDETVVLIEQRLYRLSKKEVVSRIAGEMAVKELAKIDQVAYVRLASAYKGFRDVSEFTQVIAECRAK